MNTSAVVDVLCECKAGGFSFEEGWARAMARCQVSRRDSLEGYQVTLLDPVDIESHVEFLKRVAADAWYGRKPALASLPTLMGSLSDSTDRSVFARPVKTGGGRIRMDLIA